MTTITIGGKTFPARDWELAAHDWKRIDGHMRRASESSGELIQAARSIAIIVSPLASKHVRSLNDFQMIGVLTNLFKHLQATTHLITELFGSMIGPTTAAVDRFVQTLMEINGDAR